MRDGLRHLQREPLGNYFINLIESSGPRRLAELVGVVTDLDPLAGGETQIGVGAEAIHINRFARNSGNAHDNRGVFSGPFKRCGCFVARFLDFDAIELDFRCRDIRRPARAGRNSLRNRRRSARPECRWERAGAATSCRNNLWLASAEAVLRRKRPRRTVRQQLRWRNCPAVSKMNRPARGRARPSARARLYPLAPEQAREDRCRHAR